MKIIAAILLSISVGGAQTERRSLQSVTAVRHWSSADATRVAIEISGQFEFKSDRLHDPERVYYDIVNSRPRVDGRRGYSEQLDDRLVKKIRVAEYAPGTTRIVLDLEGEPEIKASQLANPDRLVIEVRGPGARVIPTSSAPALPSPPPVGKPAPMRPDLPSPLRQPAPAPVRAEAPPAPAPSISNPPESPKPQQVAAASMERPVPDALKPTPSVERPATSSERITPAPSPEPVKTALAPPSPLEIGKAARHTASGETSLVRALGLKINRVVIDPGHGGHDQGTEGPKGLLEKDLVLDIAKRVGKLIEDRLSAEVIYTRTDDTFIPLEGRTQLANEKKADLFLSIHANSSPYRSISGIETYYLNFTMDKDALDVATRENASSQKSVFELRDLVQKISLHDKAEESREFAGKVQTALYSLAAKNSPAARNRGVKKAPFVVLIGANMPSVLAEIGFISNPREEMLMKKPEYRQKVAEALFHGISKYAEGLSHFQVAQAEGAQ